MHLSRSNQQVERTHFNSFGFVVRVLVNCVLSQHLDLALQLLVMCFKLFYLVKELFPLFTPYISLFRFFPGLGFPFRMLSGRQDFFQLFLQSIPLLLQVLDPDLLNSNRCAYALKSLYGYITSLQGFGDPQLIYVCVIRQRTLDLGL